MSAQVGVTSPRTKSSSSGGSSGSTGVKVHSSGKFSAIAGGLTAETEAANNQSIKSKWKKIMFYYDCSDSPPQTTTMPCFLRIQGRKLAAN